MKSYDEIQKQLFCSEKEAKYQKMMRFQEEIIERWIKDAYGDSRLFVFSDREQFHGYEKEWFEEFYERARKEVEEAGFKVVGITLRKA